MTDPIASEQAQAIILLRRLYEEFMQTEGGALVKEIEAARNRARILSAAPTVRRKVEVARQVVDYLDRWEARL